MRFSKHSLQIPKSLVSIISGLLWTASAALIARDIVQSTIALLFTLALGAFLGWYLTASAIKVKGGVTIWMIIGAVVGALSALTFIRLINENVEAVYLIVPLSLGATLGLYVGAEMNEVIPRAIQGVKIGVFVGILAAIIFLLTGLFELFQTGDRSLIVKIGQQIVISLVALPIIISIIAITLHAIISVWLDIWGYEYE